MTSTARFPTGYSSHTRTQSFSYGSHNIPVPGSVPPMPKSSGFGFPQFQTQSSPRKQSGVDTSDAQAMLEEIMQEEKFLRKEETRLADRPPERLTKLRDAHKEWIVWRVRKELDKMLVWQEEQRVLAQEAEARRAELERERLDRARHEADTARKEAEDARRAAEDEKRSAEIKDRERERVVREERERAARERAHSSGGPFPSWQRRFASGGASANASSNGYTTDREAPRQSRPSPNSGSTGPRARTQSFFPPPRSQTAQGWTRDTLEAQVAKSAFANYTEKWKTMASTTFDESRPLAYRDVPWPILSIADRAPLPSDITSRTVGAFLLSPYHSVDKSSKDRLRAALIQWHPDKFEARWLPFITDDDEREQVVEGVGAVARAINELLTGYR